MAWNWGDLTEWRRLLTWGALDGAEPGEPGPVIVAPALRVVLDPPGALAAAIRTGGLAPGIAAGHLAASLAPPARLTVTIPTGALEVT